MKDSAALSRTLAKGLKILTSFSEDRSEWGVRELSREIGLNTTTAHRLLTTLEQAGFLEQDPDSQRYRIGPRVMRLSYLYLQHNDLPKVANQVFQSYANRFAYSLYLGILEGREVINLSVLHGLSPIQVAVRPGGKEDIHSTAMGKVLAAYRYKDNLEEFVKTVNLFRKTPNTITEPQVFLKELQEVLRRGYSVNLGENYPELNAVGAPVFDQHGEVVAATSLAYPSEFIAESKLPELIDLILDISEEISYRYGGVSLKRQ